MRKSKTIWKLQKGFCPMDKLKILRFIFIMVFLTSMPLFAQVNTVQGIVVDANGDILIGATIAVKGTTSGTISNAEGKFSIETGGPDAVLLISYVGMLPQEIVVGNQTSIRVVMEPDAYGLEEVVAVGYGTRKKSDLTGAVSSVSSDEITSRPTPDVASALQGKASGVLVKSSSSSPGSKSIIQIRGVNSVNSGYEPLYIVDGIPLSDIDAIDPMDIASLEVLKDASSTAIYGSRGANGVVLITTKKGSSGKPVITYSTRYSIDKFVERLDLMNAEQFVKIYNEWERQNNPGITEENLWFNGSEFYRPTLETAGEGTDWFDVMTQIGHSQNHQLGISGGTERSTYATSVNYYSNTGIIIGSKYSRGGFRTSNSYKVTDWLTTGFDLFVNRTLHDNPVKNINITADIVSADVFDIYKMGPIDPIYKPDGTYAERTIPGQDRGSNPYCYAKENTNLKRNQRAFGNYYLNFEPVKDLNIRLSAGGDSDEGRLTTYAPTTTYDGAISGGTARIVSTARNYWISENIASYKKELGAHRFDLMGGFTYEQNVNELLDETSEGFVSDVYLFNNLGGGTNPGIPRSEKTKWQLASFLGRINYVFNEKYLITAIARRDGSSKFGKDNKWGFFPSVSGAWRISEEDFLSGNDVITYMKLRAGYGRVGNSNIGMYQSLAVYGTDNYTFGGRIVPGVSLGGNKFWNTSVDDFLNPLDNPDLQWETTASTNVGVDVSLYNRIHITLDAYYKKTHDLLMDINLVETSGFQTALMNVGSLENKGIELSLDTRIVDQGDLRWNMNGFISANRNKILELNGDPSSDWKIGQPLGVGRTGIVVGILETQEDLDNYVRPDGTPMAVGAKLGDYRIKDINGDQKIDADDRAITFNPNPDFIYAINSNLDYKNFSLGIYMYGSYGNDVYNKVRDKLTGTSSIRTNFLADLSDNYWTEERPTGNKYPRIGATGGGDSNIEDGSFFRVQNVILSYNVPVRKVLSNMRIYVSGQNLLTITKYSGYDPDVSSNGKMVTTMADDLGHESDQQFGMDYGAYPTPVSVTFGLEVTFK